MASLIKSMLGKNKNIDTKQKQKKIDSKTVISDTKKIVNEKDTKKADANYISKKERYNKTAFTTTLITKPIMSEKALDLIKNENQYVFVVSPNATKPEIKKQIENMYKVNVEKVRVSVMSRITNKFRGIKSHKRDIKKAYVTVKKGQKIDISGNI